MNADRLVLRWAAVVALNNFRQAPYPTIAGSLVFDSRIEPVEDFRNEAFLPAAVVYTDYDKDHWWHQSMNHKERNLTLTFELLVAQVKELPNDGGFSVQYPNTDTELETTLDLFEIQCSRAFRANNSAADCWRHMMPKLVNVISRRGATVEGGQKLAARQITMEANVPRGPAMGNIAPVVAKFLDDIEEMQEYAPLVDDVRQSYLADGTLTPSEKLMSAMGWTTKAGELMGYQRGPVVLPAHPFTFLDPQGEPL